MQLQSLSVPLWNEFLIILTLDSTLIYNPRVSKEPFGRGTRGARLFGGASSSKSECSRKPGSTYQEHN